MRISAHTDDLITRLGLVCRASPLVDGRRDDQAPPLGQQHTVGGALGIIPEPECPTEGDGFTSDDARSGATCNRAMTVDAPTNGPPHAYPTGLNFGEHRTL
jgi:hypothetical protein